jgi:phosphoribosyl 1,2-cyclic phosphodiesterase
MGKLDLPLHAQNIVRYNEPVQIGTLKVIPFQVSHDAAEPCGYFIANRQHESIAFISDTGTLDGVEIDADCYCIEANYDEAMLERRLEDGAVYAGLHARVTSEFGHLSIQQCDEWLRKNARNDATIIILHKSKDNAPRIASMEGFTNVHWPDERGRVQVEFGVRDKCPF